MGLACSGPGCQTDRGRSSGAALLSCTASGSITCGSLAVPARFVTFSTVNAEYGANIYSFSSPTLIIWTLDQVHMQTLLLSQGQFAPSTDSTLLGISERLMNDCATSWWNDVARYAGCRNCLSRGGALAFASRAETPNADHRNRRCDEQIPFDQNIHQIMFC